MIVQVSKGVSLDSLRIGFFMVTQNVYVAQIAD